MFGRFAKGRPEVGILKAANLGANVRRAGEDVQRGSLVMKAGTELRAAQIGVLASLGLPAIAVYRRPVVAILSTGDELLAIGAAHRGRQDLRLQRLQHRRAGHGGRRRARDASASPATRSKT